MLKKGSFVHVVANVDVTSGEGKILYVNPANTSLPSAGTRSDDFELVALDAQGQELGRFKPVVRLPASTPRSGPVPAGTHGLIQEDVPQLPGLHAVVLMYKGAEQSRFTAGAPAPLNPTAPAAAGVQGSRRAMRAGPTPAEPGVTYTVQVKPENSTQWSTIAVGRANPSFDLDRNQFPGAKRAVVRVLRSTGISQTVVSEQEMSLEF